VRNAKVRYHRPAALAIDEYVFRFHIPVYDSSAVRIGKGERYVTNDARSVVWGKDTALANKISERSTIDERHYNDDPVFQVLDCVDRNDVRMLKLGRSSCFAKKVISRFVSSREVQRQCFDGHRTLEHDVPPEIDSAHSPPTQQALERVPVNQRALQREEIRVQCPSRVCSGYRINVPPRVFSQTNAGVLVRAHASLPPNAPGVELRRSAFIIHSKFKLMISAQQQRKVSAMYLDYFVSDLPGRSLNGCPSKTLSQELQTLPLGNFEHITQQLLA
jgi:hypothetical protein